MPTDQPSLLNDLSRPMRALTAAQGAGIGLVLGSPAVAAAGRLTLAGVIVAAGVVALLGPMLVLVIRLRRADQAFWADLARLGAELADGRVEGITVPGRVVRRRIAADHPSYSTSSAAPQPGPSVVLVATVLTQDGPRRAAALAPALVGLESRKAPVLLRLHPARQDAAILVTDASAEEHRAAGADPRWGTDKLPTDRSVTGGYLALLGVGAAGVALALGAVFLVLLILG